MGWEQGWQELQPSRVVEVLSHPPQELRIRVSGWGSWVGKRESSEIGVLGQRERGCVREGIKPLFFFILWLLLLLQPFLLPWIISLRSSKGHGNLECVHGGYSQ